MSIKAYAILAKEHIVSIRDVQKNPSKSLRGLTRVMNGSKTHGFFFSIDDMDDLMEDIEMSMSKSLRATVKKARLEIKRGETISLDDFRKKYDL